MISIIVPVYNCRKYLTKCIESIIHQDEKEWELLLIDDGSTDGSEKLCDLYATQDKRIKVIHQENKGVSDARNHGLDLAEGEYICFADADDWLAPQFFSTMLGAAKREEADIVQCSYYEVLGEQLKKGKGVQVDIVNENYEAMKQLLEDRETMYAVWNKLFARKLLNGLQFKTQLALHEDACFCLEAYGKSEKSVVLKDALYFYLQRESSAAHSVFSDKSMSSVYGTRYMLEYTEKHYPDLKVIAERYHIMYVLVSIRRIHQEKKEKQYCSYLKELKKILHIYMVRALMNPCISLKAKGAILLYAI